MFIKLIILAIVPLAYTFTQVIMEEIPFRGYGYGVGEGNADGDGIAVVGAGAIGRNEDYHTPKVCTKYAGCMVGKLFQGYRIDNFEGFVGIPYALPPVGELRFSVSITNHLYMLIYLYFNRHMKYYYLFSQCNKIYIFL